MEDANMDLALMVRPPAGSPSSVQDIWDKVVGDDVRMPGTFDLSVHGALEAARQGDWALCAYLAARCFKDAGSEEDGARALAQPDTLVGEFLWMTGMDPIVVDVPLGLERLWVKPDDTQEPELIPSHRLAPRMTSDGLVAIHGRCAGTLARGLRSSAERLVPGTILEMSHLVCPQATVQATPQGQHQRKTQQRRPASAGPVRPGGQCGVVPLRRLQLQPEDLRTVYSILHEEVHEDEESWCDHVKAKLMVGGRYHVLCYPLAGDLTKVLLRPVRRPVLPVGTLLALGETLASQCAKSGQWELLRVLLKAGVPCPDLAKEFANLCGRQPAVRRRWLQDLSAVEGRPTSLIALAAQSSAGAQSLATLLRALREAQQPVYIQDCQLADGQPILEGLAEAFKWDMVKAILEELEEEGTLCAASMVDLAKSPSLSHAPREVLELIEGLLLVERTTGVRARSLKEYFERQVAGEVMDGLGPLGFNQADGTLTDHISRLLVLDCASRLLGARFIPGAGTEIIFARVPSESLEAAAAALASPGCAMLPVDLGGRAATLRDPSEGGAWLPLLCPTAYLSSCGAGNLDVLCIPAGHIPTPYVLQPSVHVSVVTPCCRQPLAGVIVQIGGHRAGVTNASGSLLLTLPPGRHVISAPGVSRHSEEVEVKASGCQEPTAVNLTMSSELFVFLSDMSSDEESWRRGIMLVANRDAIPNSAEPYLGPVSLVSKALVGGATSASKAAPHSPRRGGRGGVFRPAAALKSEQPCDEVVHVLQAQLAMYAPMGTEAIARRFLFHISAFASPAGFLTCCFHSWSRWCRMQKQQDCLANAARVSTAEIAYQPNLDASSWVANLLRNGECAAAKIFEVPLRLGSLVECVQAPMLKTSSRSSCSEELVEDPHQRPKQQEQLQHEPSSRSKLRILRLSTPPPPRLAPVRSSSVGPPIRHPKPPNGEAASGIGCVADGRCTHGSQDTPRHGCSATELGAASTSQVQERCIGSRPQPCKPWRQGILGSGTAANSAAASLYRSTSSQNVRRPPAACQRPARRPGASPVRAGRFVFDPYEGETVHVL